MCRTAEIDLRAMLGEQTCRRHWNQEQYRALVLLRHHLEAPSLVRFETMAIVTPSLSWIPKVNVPPKGVLGFSTANGI